MMMRDKFFRINFLDRSIVEEDTMHNKDEKTDWSVRSTALIFFLILFIIPFVSHGQTARYWIGGDGQWSDDTKWTDAEGTPIGVPSAGDDALFWSTGGIVTYNVVSSLTLRMIDIDGMNPLTLSMEAGQLTTASTFVQLGMFNQSGGIHTINDSLGVGMYSGALGTYALSGSAVLVRTLGETKIGGEGIGYFVQSDSSSFTFGGSLYLGDANYEENAEGNPLQGYGRYTMNGGTLQNITGEFGEIILGEWGGKGEFIQSGGAVAISWLTLARQENSIGNYVLSGGTLRVAGVTYVGEQGTGTFNQYNGTTHTAGGLFVGGFGGNPGNGTYNLVSGELNVASDTVIGDGGIGVFNQGFRPDTEESDDGGNLISGNLYIGFNSLEDNQYNLYAGTLTVNGFTVIGGKDNGPDSTYGNGTFNQWDGTHRTGGLWLGDTVGSIGTYNLFSGGLITDYWNVIGARGTGIFNQYDGTYTASGPLEVGGAGNGTYNLADGILSTNGTIVGNWGTGTFNQGLDPDTGDITPGGTHTVNGDLVFGANGGTSGTYNLYNGALNVTGNTFVGFFGTGAFTQSSGTHTTSGLVLGQFKGSSGTYALSGDGYLSIANDIYLGVEGTGSFIQNDTSTVEANNLFIGTSGGAGTYELRGGSLSLTGVVSVGYSGIGTFTQSGGTHTVSGNLVLGEQQTGSGGTYLLSGDSSVFLQVGGNELIGWEGTGTFTQDGGIHTVAGDLNLAQGAPTEGYFNLNGGNLSVDGSLNIGHDGVGIFTQNGGTNTVGWNLVLGNNATGNGTYVLENGTLEVSGSFRGGEGTSTFIIDGQPRNGITGYSLTYPDETLSLTNFIVGSASGKTGLFTLPAGKNLSTNWIDVGSGGTGTFNQTGGTTMVNNVLVIGRNTGALGTYTLSGDNAVTLRTGQTHIGAFGTGILTQSGGTHTTGTLVLGYNTGGTGTYEMTDGTLTAADRVVIGMDGTGTFTQTGGTVTTGSMVIAQNSGGSGLYDFRSGNIYANYIDVNRGGTLRGAGNIYGNVHVNGGIVAPGNSPGTLNINGVYIQDEFSTLSIELGGTEQGITYDLLRIYGTASLTGTLDINLYGEYTPTAGTSYDILIADAIIGIGDAGFQGFTNIIGPNGWIWTVQYMDGSTTDTVSLTANAVPIPGALWFFAPALAGLIGLRRRFTK
jgi:hypothetical protein